MKIKKPLTTKKDLTANEEDKLSKILSSFTADKLLECTRKTILANKNLSKSKLFNSPLLLI